MDLNYIEIQLQKRLAYPYKWHGKQNNTYDTLTKFIYTSDNFDRIFIHINSLFLDCPESKEKCDYALNRWFNYWSSQAIEYIFSLSDRVVPAPNARDRTTDFTIDGVKFDHKTSVFPRGYSKSLAYAQADPDDLIRWLYLNQSQQQRMHFKNRLFLVLYAIDGQHWKLKADISWLHGIIDGYIEHLSVASLHRFEFESKSTTLSDIIWGVK